MLNGEKYACDLCIRGHRSSSCNHRDRQLTKLKPKGRPSTTCMHCKEMRKVKNVNPSGGCPCGKIQNSKNENELKVLKKAAAGCTCLTGGTCRCHIKRRRAKNEDQSPISTTQTTDSSVDNLYDDLISGPILLDDVLTPIFDDASPTMSGSVQQGSIKNLSPIDEFLIDPKTPLTVISDDEQNSDLSSAIKNESSMADIIKQFAESDLQDVNGLTPTDLLQPNGEEVSLLMTKTEPQLNNGDDKIQNPKENEDDLFMDLLDLNNLPEINQYDYDSLNIAPNLALNNSTPS